MRYFMKFFLDFGHGGKDSGAVGLNGTFESNVVLKIGLMLKSMLEDKNHTVITSRIDNTYYSLTYRTDKANRYNCDYFISLHMNSYSNKNASGCEVWVYDKSSKLYNTSQSICNNLSKTLNTPNRGVKVSKKFTVLKKSKMPALLIEVDFISNPLVEDICCSYDYCYSVAHIICSSLLSL